MRKSIENKVEYMASYGKKYKALKKSIRDKRSAGKPPQYTQYIEDKYLIDKHKNTALVVPPTMKNFAGTDELEPTVCSVFGCKNILSHEHRLYGTTCIHHQKKKKLDITLFVSQSKIA